MDGRGRLSSFDALPAEADEIIEWADGELSRRDMTQKEIYAEFVQKCELLMGSHHGEMEFTIPSMSSFNRHSTRQARMTRGLAQTRKIIAAVAEVTTAKDVDELTIMTSEMIKSLVMGLIADGEKRTPLEAMQMASAIKQASQAQHVSSDRRARHERDFEAATKTAVEQVTKQAGLTAETAEQIMRDVLGVRAKADEGTS